MPVTVKGLRAMNLSRRNRRRLQTGALLFILLLMTACGEDDPPAGATTDSPDAVTRVVTEVVTTTPEIVEIEVTRLVEEIVEITPAPSPTPIDTTPRSLVVCMVSEPESLYPYSAANLGSAGLAAQAIRHAVYENLYTTLSYGFQAQGLEKMPSLAEGDALISEVTVTGGERVLDAQGRVVTLVAGTLLRDAAGNQVTFDGSPLTMIQMSVTFVMQPLVWSDGTPVTADDSVFSFELAADPLTPVSKEPIDRTVGYEALDERTVVWTGVPGLLDPLYFTNIWPPLPRHQLGDLGPQALLDADASNRQPLSNGPFVIEEWVAGSTLTLVPNEHYYRRDDGYPLLDQLTFLFVENSDQLMARLLSQQCDVATQDGLDVNRASLLLEAEAAGILVPYLQIGNVFEHIDFGVNSDIGVEARPDWFEDVRVRQAMTMCTDRQRMVDELLLGLSEVSHAYIPSVHPLFPEELTRWPYDVERATALLDEALFLDRDGDGVREEPRVRNPLRLTLYFNASSEIRQKALAIFQENMTECGIEIALESLPAPDLFDPRGPVFGRRFELVAFPWLSGIRPPCNLYTSVSIPDEENGWRGNNNTGWSDPLFDEICGAAQRVAWDSDAYREQHQAAVVLFSEALPIIPLFSYLNVAAVQPHVRNFRMDSTQASELWNLYELTIDPVAD